MIWQFSFSPELLQQKKTQLKNSHLKPSKSKASSQLRDQQMVCEEENEGKPQFLINDHSRERYQEKAKLKDFTLTELFKPQYLSDYDRQIKNIVQMIHLHPIKLKIPQEILKYLYLSVLSEINQPAKEINLKISANYEVIGYKNRLFLASKIMITQQPASNYDNNRFDIYVYCETGEMICSFHNFDTMEKLIKYLRRKFRRIETIYFLHVLNDGNLSLDQYMEAKMILQAKKSQINLKGIFCSTKQDLKPTELVLTTPKYFLNTKELSKEDFDKFCVQNSIKIIQQQQLELSMTTDQDQFLRFTRSTLKKRVFDDEFLKKICFGDEKVILYRKRNQISLRLMNYYFSKLSISLNEDQTFNPSTSKIQSFFTQLVYEILQEKQNAEAKEIQRIRQQPTNHELQLLDINPRQCIKCKSKTKYRCKKCSLKYQIETMLCKECFEDFHSDHYFKTQALPILTRKTRKQNGLGKNRSRANRIIQKNSYRNRIRQRARRIELLKLTQTQNEQHQPEIGQISNQRDEENVRFFKEHRKMQNFILECQKSIKFSF